jgi:WD40 repeat protein
VSNCYRYLVSGSEDRSAYVYDIGSAKVIEKTKNKDHRDSVTDIAINPQVFEWSTACIDGHVRCYRYPAKKIVKGQTYGRGGGGIQEKPNSV